MLFVMFGSIIITFLMLGLATRLPDPYWSILLHLHEAPLAVFLFCSIGMFLHSFNTISGGGTIYFRGHEIRQPGLPGLSWKQMIAFLMAASALAYRLSLMRAFVAFHERPLIEFNPWSQRGNVFCITLAVISSVIAIAHLKETKWRDRLMAYATAAAALVSFSPLLMTFKYPAYHPFSVFLVLFLAVVFFLISRFIQRKWGIL